MQSADVRRGVCRWLVRAGVMPVAEVNLGCGRRADVLGLDGAGRLTLVEIKVSLGDLRGDAKWPDYLDWCDRFFWGVPESLAGAVMGEAFEADRTGVLVADRFDAALVRDAPWAMVSGPRRKALTLRLARNAAARLAQAADPEMAALAAI